MIQKQAALKYVYKEYDMENELLNIFDGNRNKIGTAERHEVHRAGLWHEVFHCWIVSREQAGDFLYLQLRSEKKKDYPHLFDITAAGHLLFDESPADGIREIEEELGLPIEYDDLIPLGVTVCRIEQDKMIDAEFAHVYLSVQSPELEDFLLQEEETAGIVKANVKEFANLWEGNLSEIRLKGFLQVPEGRKEIDMLAGKESFVPHGSAFYREIIDKIARQLS